MNTVIINRLIWIAIIISLIWVYSNPQKKQVTEVPYSRFKQLLVSGEVLRVKFKGDSINVDLNHPVAAGRKGESTEKIITYMPQVEDPKLFAQLEAAGVEIQSLPETESRVSIIFYSLLPWLILIGIYWFFWSRMQNSIGGGMGSRGVKDFMAGSANEVRHETPKVSFNDVAGQENAKQEVAELVEFLNAPEKYRRLGAVAPRGVLLVGPPGTGKTLLARALAGEAGVPFFNISASEFIELYVGVGASRVRNMFEAAKQRAPCIIFIDEIDSIGRTRGTGLGGGHDEREQTLNQILAEMDGFIGHEAVIVLAATNRPDVLDPALLRPGRFDRHVTLELPDKKARNAILKVHTRKIPLASDVDLDKIAATIPGFSGADIKNLSNEAAILATREGADKVHMCHFDLTRDKVMMGSVRTLAIQPEERHRLAVHESGHTAVAFFLPNADPLYKVSIIPRGRALGSTQTLPEEERHTLDENYLKDRLAIMLGGRTAEKIMLDSVSSGADDDIKQASSLARAMVGRWGMSEEIGPMDVRESEAHPFLGREIAQPRRFSEITAHKVDEAVRRLLKEAEEQAVQIISDHQAEIEQLIAQLEEHETLDQHEIESCLGSVKLKSAESRDVSVQQC
jgi:cell division protease FtsH